MERFVKPAGRARAPGNRTPSPRPGDDVGPRVQVQRVTTGWFDEAAGQCKLKGVPTAQGGFVFVEKPSLDYFLRGGRKRAPSKLAPVFEYELMKVITPHVAWTPKGGPPDTVCMSCFDVLKSARDGTVKKILCRTTLGPRLRRTSPGRPARRGACGACCPRREEREDEIRAVFASGKAEKAALAEPAGGARAEREGQKRRRGDPGEEGQGRAQRGLGAGRAENSGAEQNPGAGRVARGKSFLSILR